MMEAALSLVPDDGPQSLAEAIHRIRELEAELATRRTTDDLQDEINGHLVTIRKQSREIGVLTKRIAEEEDPMTHPKGRDIVDLIERWKRGARPKAKVSADRVKLVKARLKDEYTMEELTLAIDGLCAYPYRRYDDRLPEDAPAAKKDDDLEVALKKAARVEMFARLGHQARKQGWSVDGGWPS